MVGTNVQNNWRIAPLVLPLAEQGHKCQKIAQNNALKVCKKALKNPPIQHSYVTHLYMAHALVLLKVR